MNSGRTDLFTMILLKHTSTGSRLSGMLQLSSHTSSPAPCFFLGATHFSFITLLAITSLNSPTSLLTDSDDQCIQHHLQITIILITFPIFILLVSPFQVYSLLSPSNINTRQSPPASSPPQRERSGCSLSSRTRANTTPCAHLHVYTYSTLLHTHFTHRGSISFSVFFSY